MIGIYMAKTFSETEQNIVSIFRASMEKNIDVQYNGQQFKVLKIDKPTCSSGEPKTDIYAVISNEFNTHEIKISIKQNNADFLENKMSSEAALRLFGTNWEQIICTSTMSISDQFENRTLIYKNSSGQTEAGCITLGWKFELLNKAGGALSGEIDVDPIEVYKGLLLSDDKKNALVDGERISNSGIAEYILITDKNTVFTSVDSVLSQMELIDDYVKKYPKIYFACKALNYRSLHNPPKWDGDRPLSVFVDWDVEKGGLIHKIKYNAPLVSKGHAVARKLQSCLNQIGVSNTCELNESNIGDYSICN
jgi:hypothetical protein